MARMLGIPSTVALFLVIMMSSGLLSVVTASSGGTGGGGHSWVHEYLYDDGACSNLIDVRSIDLSPEGGGLETSEGDEAMTWRCPNHPHQHQHPSHASDGALVGNTTTPQCADILDYGFSGQCPGGTYTTYPLACDYCVDIGIIAPGSPYPSAKLSCTAGSLSLIGCTSFGCTSGCSSLWGGPVGQCISFPILQRTSQKRKHPLNGRGIPVPPIPFLSFYINGTANTCPYQSDSILRLRSASNAVVEHIAAGACDADVARPGRYHRVVCSDSSQPPRLQFPNGDDANPEPGLVRLLAAWINGRV